MSMSIARRTLHRSSSLSLHKSFSPLSLSASQSSPSSMFLSLSSLSSSPSHFPLSFSFSLPSSTNSLLRSSSSSSYFSSSSSSSSSPPAEAESSTTIAESEIIRLRELNRITQGALKVEKVKINDVEVDVLGSSLEYPLKIRLLVTQIMNLTMLENKFLTDLLADQLGLPRNQIPGIFGGGPAFGAGNGSAASASGSGSASASGSGSGSGSAPAAGGAAADAKPAAPAAEKKAFTVQLVSFESAGKIKVIKEVRQATGLGLKESKDLVEGTLPREVKKDLKKEEADALIAKFKEAGAVATAI